MKYVKMYRLIFDLFDREYNGVSFWHRGSNENYYLVFFLAKFVLVLIWSRLIVLYLIDAICFPAKHGCINRLQAENHVGNDMIGNSFFF